MAQLKQTLAAEGYDVTKSNRQVKAATLRLVKRETFVRTTRSASLRLNKKVINPFFKAAFLKCVHTVIHIYFFLTPDIDRQKEEPREISKAQGGKNDSPIKRANTKTKGQDPHGGIWIEQPKGQNSKTRAKTGLQAKKNSNQGAKTCKDQSCTSKENTEKTKAISINVFRSDSPFKAQLTNCNNIKPLLGAYINRQ